MKSIWLSEIEDYLFETVDFKDFPNAGIFATNTLCRDQDSNLGYCDHNAMHYTITANGLDTTCILILH